MAIETYSLTIQGWNLQEPNDVVLHFKGDGLTADDTWTSGTDLIDSFSDAIESLWLACMPGTYYLSRYSTRRVHPKGFSTEAHRQFVQGSRPGTIAGEAQTQNLCPVIRLIPPMGTKTMGKVFMPCVAEGSINENAYTAGYLTAIDDLFGALLGTIAIGTINWNLAVYSRKLDATAVIQAYIISPAIGFQGRRRSPV